MGWLVFMFKKLKDCEARCEFDSMDDDVPALNRISMDGQA
jgi:hypothetical protein